MKLVIAALALLVAYLNYESVQYNFNLTGFNNSYKINSDNPLYNCTYAGLWCTCFTRKGGGCTVGCSPNTYYKLTLKKECPQVSDFVLSSFQVVN